MGIPSAQQPIKVGANTIDVTEHSAEFSCVLADVSTSGNGSGSIFAPVIPMNTWNASWPLDDAALPDALGIIPGANITLKLRVGGTAYILTNTSVESFGESSNSTQDVPRIQARGKGGVLTSGTF